MKNEKTTLVDRAAIGFGCAVIAFFTSLILWMFTNWLFIPVKGDIVIPFYFVWIFTTAGFGMGILTLENDLLKFLSRIWGLVYSFLKGSRY